MSNAAPLIPPVQLAASPPLSAASRKDTGAFSYDDAVAALERQASRSINTHGGAPSRVVAAGNNASSTEQGQPSRQPETGRTAANTQPPNTPDAPEARQIAADPNRPAAPAIAYSASGNPGAALTPVAPGGGAPAAQSPVSAVRDAAARLKADAPRATVIGRQPAPTVTHFAEILAQRLDKASQFDLRLDPPALGQIDGRLTLGDDGNAVLSLAFDNQSAFDLFSRDEPALRQALADAGFALGGGDLQFRFQEPSGAVDADLDAVTAAQPASFITPAALHSGAIDIRA